MTKQDREALAAAIEKLPRHMPIAKQNAQDKITFVGTEERADGELVKLSDVLALLAGVSAERSEKEDK